MALGNGVFFSHGISIGATLSGSQIVPVYPSKATDAIRFILMVDGDGNAIVPEMIPASQGIDTGEGRIGGMKYTTIGAAELTTVKNRVTALEAKQWTITEEKTADYTAASWEHVILNTGALSPGTITVTMPASPANGDRVRVSEVSTGGGTFANVTLKVACTFATVTGGYYAASPYAFAPDGDNYGRVGATIELEYVDTLSGWIILQESYQPARP